MLKSVDILIGLSVVMLVVSMAVTLLTQVVVSALNTRGGHLRRGLSDLLQQLDPALTAEISKDISKAVLTSPLVSDVGKRLGTVVHREEFIKILLDLASANGPRKLEPVALGALTKAMQNNGIADPKATLDNIRSLALSLEAANPELANNVRLNAAIIEAAGSQFVAKIHGWFDQTIDRVGGRFTASTRGTTIAVALIVAFAIQLDSIALVNRLSTDTQLRQTLIQSAKNIDQGQQAGGGTSASPGASPGAGPGDTSKNSPAVNPQKQTGGSAAAPKAPAPEGGKSSTALEDSTKPGSENGSTISTAASSSDAEATNPSVPNRVVSDVDAILGSTGLISAPDWTWKSITPQKVLGILLSAILLSMGAPFWYDTLKTSLRLRSAIADTDDAQRQERQTTQTSPQAGDTDDGMTTPAGALAGERGNLGAIG